MIKKGWPKSKWPNTQGDQASWYWICHFPPSHLTKLVPSAVNRSDWWDFHYRQHIPKIRGKILYKYSPPSNFQGKLKFTLSFLLSFSSLSLLTQSLTLTSKQESPVLPQCPNFCFAYYFTKLLHRITSLEYFVKAPYQDPA